MNVIKLREDLKLSQLQLAFLIGAHPMTISKWENKKLLPKGIYLLALTGLKKHGVNAIKILLELNSEILKGNDS